MTFVKVWDIPTQHYSQTVDQIKTGDFNGDGNNDFVVCRIDYKELGTSLVPLQLYLGDGKGGFRDGTVEIFGTVPLVNYVAAMVVSDFNKDNVSDLFCIDTGMDKPPYSGGINKLFLSSNGKLTDSTNLFPQVFRTNHGASVGDINNDGKLDIVVNALIDAGNYALINTGSGFFETKTILPNRTVPAEYNPSIRSAETYTSSALIDINRDGYVDLILGNHGMYNSSKTALLVLNDGKGSFANNPVIELPKSRIEYQTVLDIKPIDVNRDGLPDLLLSVTNNAGGGKPSYEIGYIQILVNKGNGLFEDESDIRINQDTTKKQYNGSYKTIDVIDLNSDGFDDIVLDGNYPKTVLINDKTGKFVNDFNLNQFQHVAVGDFNNDGRSDLIANIKWDIDGFELYLNQYASTEAGQKIIGKNNSNIFQARAGNDTYVGAAGIDVINYEKPAKNFTITIDQSKVICAEAGSTFNTLISIERIKFLDKAIALDIEGNAGQAYRLYQAALDRTPDDRGLAGWINYMDNSGQLNAMAQMFIDSQEFRVKYGALDNFNFVNQLYLNVLDRNGEATGVNAWVGALNSGALTRAQVLVGFSESNENKANVIGQIKDGIAYNEYWLT